jgi:hypothetical protein
MTISNSAIRFCVLNRSGGPLEVVLTATNTLQAGARFNVVPPDGSVAEEFRLASGAAGEQRRQLQTAASVLERGGLTWTILCCSILAQVETGVVEVSVLQDGVRCPMTVDARYSFVDVPQCNAPRDNVMEQRGSLRFLFG